MCGTRVGPVERVAARLRLIFRHDPTCKSILQSTNYGLALRDERHEEKILAARSLRVDASLGDVVASRIFIQNPSDTSAVMAKIGERFRGIDPAMTLTCPPLSSKDYKVEVEVTAYRGASKSNIEVKNI